MSTLQRAALNPLARYRDPITVADVLASRLEVGPLDLLVRRLVDRRRRRLRHAPAQRGPGPAQVAVYVLGTVELHRTTWA